MQGFRNARVGNPEVLLKDLRELFPGVELQLLRAERVAGREHLILAATNAIDSFKGKDRRARLLSMEFLLFASGEHQIVEAIKLIGVTPSTTELVVAGIAERETDLNGVTGTISRKANATPDDAVIELQSAKKIRSLKKAYKISDRELESTRVSCETDEMILKRLVIERSAMLVLEN